WIGSEKGPAGGSTPPLPDGFDGDVEPNARAMAADKALVGRGEEQSAARRYHHAAPRRERCQGLPLALAKVALSTLVEQRFDRASLGGFHELVRIDELVSDALGQGAADRRLPRAHESDEKDPLRKCVPIHARDRSRFRGGLRSALRAGVRSIRSGSR